MSISEQILSILPDFEGISLVDVQKASLMRRKDCKYLFSFSQVPQVLKEVRHDYRVLDIEGKRSHNYQTLYYDTFDLEMYHMHHRGKVNRHKIRFRKYGSSDAIFFEVKKKDAKGVTVKNRIRSHNGEDSILSREEEFLSKFTPFEGDRIIPVLENTFKRITLVGLDQSERITLDYHLWFSSRMDETSMEVPGISIAEIKFSTFLSASPFHSAMRRAGIVPSRFSKYCMGMAMLDPELKQNLFKQKIRRIQKINNEYLKQTKEQHYA